MTLAIELGWEGAKAKEEINNMESLVDQSANVWNKMAGKSLGVFSNKGKTKERKGRNSKIEMKTTTNHTSFVNSVSCYYHFTAHFARKSYPQLHLVTRRISFASRSGNEKPK